MTAVSDSVHVPPAATLTYKHPTGPRQLATSTCSTSGPLQASPVALELVITTQRASNTSQEEHVCIVQPSTQT